MGLFGVKEQDKKNAMMETTTITMTVFLLPAKMLIVVMDTPGLVGKALSNAMMEMTVIIMTALMIAPFQNVVMNKLGMKRAEHKLVMMEMILTVMNA